MGSALRAEEEWLRQCIEAATPGSVVRQHDDGTAPGMHDLDIWVDGRRVGAVEVSAAVDPSALELWNLVADGDLWTDGSLFGGWRVTVERTASARLLKTHLPSLLHALESQGRHRIPAGVRGGWSAEDELAEHLSTRSVHRHDTGTPGSVSVVVGFLPAQSGGAAPQAADGVAAWVGGWLGADHQRDNRAKLARSGAPERHMAVLIAGYSPAPFDVVYALAGDTVAVLTVDPALPSEKTHCWVLSTWNSGQGFRWAPSGWSTFSKLQPP